jgi:hypothetical protein
MNSSICPRCAGTNGNHGLVHERYGNGGGGNRPCPDRPITPLDAGPVKVGDTVTVERPRRGDRITQLVRDVNSDGFILAGFGKRFRLGDEHNDLWTLTGHQPQSSTT